MREQDTFQKIYAGELPSRKVYDDGEFFAILDINPLSDGHTLVIPVSAPDKIYDMSDENFAKFFLVAKKIAKNMEEKLGTRIGFAVEGLDVPHAHIHLVPLYEKEKAEKGDPLQLHHGYPVDTSAENLDRLEKLLASK